MWRSADAAKDGQRWIKCAVDTLYHTLACLEVLKMGDFSNGASLVKMRFLVLILCAFLHRLNPSHVAVIKVNQ